MHNRTLRAILFSTALLSGLATGQCVQQGGSPLGISFGLMEAQAATITNTYYNGNTIGTLDSDGLLTITAKPGTDGRMNDYNTADRNWNSSTTRPKIKNIVISSGVTYIGKYNLYTYPNLETFTVEGNPEFNNSASVSFLPPQVVCSLSKTTTNGAQLSLVNGVLTVNNPNLLDDNSTIVGWAGLITDVQIIGDYPETNKINGSYYTATMIPSLTVGSTVDTIVNIFNPRSVGDLTIEPGNKLILRDCFQPGAITNLTINRDMELYDDDMPYGTSSTIIGNGANIVVNLGDYDDVRLTKLELRDGSVLEIKNSRQDVWIGNTHIDDNSQLVFNTRYATLKFAGDVYLGNDSTFNIVCSDSDVRSVSTNGYKILLSNGSKLLARNVAFDGKSGVNSTPINIPDNCEISVRLRNFNIEHFGANLTLGDYALSGSKLSDDSIIVEVQDMKLNSVPINTKNLLIKGDLNVNISAYTELEKLYVLGKIGSSLTKPMIPSTAMVYCIAGSPVETWCKNNSVAYTVLSDEEVESLLNGTLPSLQQSEQLFDNLDKQDIDFTVSLGTKPAGADGIKQVIIDNKSVPKTEYEFNGTDTVTIKFTYLEKLTNGVHTVSIQFDNNIFKSGSTVTVINSGLSGGGTKPPEALVTIKYEFYKDYPDHVIIPVTMNGATEITKLKIGTEVVDDSNYYLEDSAIIISKDYLSTLETGKYRVLPTFNDINNTTISNIQLLVYEHAADRAAPYLLQTRIIFGGAPILLNYDPGEGDLQASNVLALVIDDSIVLPDGRLLPLTASNTDKVTKAYNELINGEEEKPPVIASSSNALPAEPKPEAEKPEAEKPEAEKPEAEKPEAEKPSEGTGETEAPETSKPETEAPETSKPETEAPETSKPETEAPETSKPETEAPPADKEEIDPDFSVMPEDATTEASTVEIEASTAETETTVETEVMLEDSEIPYSPVVANLSKEEIKKSLAVGLEQQSGIMTLIQVENSISVEPVFVVSGTEIVVSGDYIESLGLSEGDHLIGAIFDNTERTTDLKKVILTIPKTVDPEPEPTPPTPPAPEPENPPVVPPTPEPEPEKPNPPVPPTPAPEPEKPTPPTPPAPEKPKPDTGNGGSGNGGSGNGGSTKPNNNNGPAKPQVPNTGGDFQQVGDDFIYIKPDGTQAKDEWVADGKHWYHIGADGIMNFDWFLGTKDNQWYMLNREHDGTFGAALTGWYLEKQDGRWYYLNPNTTEMLTGWQFIDGKWYYFAPYNEGPTYFGDNKDGWRFNSNTSIRPYGSMYVNETTPDGYRVDESGAWIQ